MPAGWRFRCTVEDKGPCSSVNTTKMKERPVFNLYSTQEPIYRSLTSIKFVLKNWKGTFQDTLLVISDNSTWRFKWSVESNNYRITILVLLSTNTSCSLHRWSVNEHTQSVGSIVCKDIFACARNLARFSHNSGSLEFDQSNAANYK